MDEGYEIRHTVRSYELDLLGHVNNAVFLQWIEHARLALFESLGYTVGGLVQRSWLNNVVRIEIDYRRPAYACDRITIRTRIEEVGRTSLSLAHTIRRAEDPPDERPLARARAVVVWLDVESGRPVRVPDRIRDLAAAPGRPGEERETDTGGVGA